MGTPQPCRFATRRGDQGRSIRGLSVELPGAENRRMLLALRTTGFSCGCQGGRRLRPELLVHCDLSSRRSSFDLCPRAIAFPLSMGQVQIHGADRVPPSLAAIHPSARASVRRHYTILHRGAHLRGVPQPDIWWRSPCCCLCWKRVVRIYGRSKRTTRDSTYQKRT